MINKLGSVYWHSTLQGKSLPIHENDPQEGWYRTRPRKGYRSLPVRIWRDEGSGELLALRDGKRVDPYQVWTWVCLNPVSVEAYEAVLERNGNWPDEAKTGAYRRGGRLEDPTRSAMPALSARERHQPDWRRGTLAKALPHSHSPSVGAAYKMVTASGDPNGPHVRAAYGKDQRQVLSKTSSAAAPVSKAALNEDPPMTYVRAAVVSDFRVLGSDEQVTRDVEGRFKPELVSVSKKEEMDGSANALAIELSELWNEVSDWLAGLGGITDQVTADLCANYAEAFADLEKKAEGFRTTAKKPVLDQGRAIDQRWKPIVSAADEAKRHCKKALEPFLIAETERLEREWLEAVKAENGDLSLLGLSSLTAKAGTFGRTISLRRVRKVRVSDRTALLNHYHRDPRFMNDEAVQKLLTKLAEHDLQAGLSVPGADSVEEKVAA